MHLRQTRGRIEVRGARDGKLVGVLTADFDVLALCKYLREVDLGEDAGEVPGMAGLRGSDAEGPGRREQVALLDLLAEQGVADFESLSMLSSDGGFVTIAREDLDAVAEIPLTEVKRHPKADEVYYLEERERPGEFMPIFEDEHGTYIMNSRDLRAVEHVQRLVAIGVDCLKIEGRLKGPAYVVTAVEGLRRWVERRTPLVDACRLDHRRLGARRIRRRSRRSSPRDRSSTRSAAGRCS